MTPFSVPCLFQLSILPVYAPVKLVTRRAVCLLLTIATLVSLDLTSKFAQRLALGSGEPKVF